MTQHKSLNRHPKTALLLTSPLAAIGLFIAICLIASDRLPPNSSDRQLMFEVEQFDAAAFACLDRNQIDYQFSGDFVEISESAHSKYIDRCA
jgi:hypothetical protein